jgi:tetratricopeptide (TPR) repeat protein
VLGTWVQIAFVLGSIASIVWLVVDLRKLIRGWHTARLRVVLLLIRDLLPAFACFAALIAHEHERKQGAAIQERLSVLECEFSRYKQALRARSTDPGASEELGKSATSCVDLWLAQAKDAIDSGIVNIARRNYALAITHFDYAIRSEQAPDSSRGEACYFRGVAQLFMADTSGAIASWEAGARWHPRDWYTMYNLAVAYALTGHPDLALLSIDKAISIGPDSSAGWAIRGSVLDAMDSLGSAERAFERATALDSTVGWVWYNYAATLRRVSQPARALEAYDRAIALSPDTMHSAWYNKGKLLTELGSLDLAADALRQSVRINPGKVIGWLALGRVLGALGRHGEARDCFDAALRIDPHARDAQYERAMSFYNETRWSDASTEFTEFVSSYPDQWEGWHALGLALDHLPDLPAAANALRRATETNPQSDEAWYSLGMVEMEQGDHRAAAASFRRAVTIAPSRLDPWLNLGAVMILMKQYKLATATYEEAIAVHGDHGGLWLNLGAALLLQKRDREAAAAFGRAVQMDSTDAQAWYDLAIAQYRLHQLAPAAVSIQWALRLRPDDPTIGAFARDSLLYQPKSTP